MRARNPQETVLLSYPVLQVSSGVSWSSCRAVINVFRSHPLSFQLYTRRFVVYGACATLWRGTVCCRSYCKKALFFLRGAENPATGVLVCLSRSCTVCSDSTSVATVSHVPRCRLASLFLCVLPVSLLRLLLDVLRAERRASRVGGSRAIRAKYQQQ